MLLMYPFPKDAMRWILDNYQDYQLNHSLALIFTSVGGRLGTNNHALNKMIGKVKTLYTEKGEVRGR